ncbi:MAG: HRDC domain-containing protein, partial [Deltaproteobacteria bacterium]
GEKVMLGKGVCRIVWPERHAPGYTKDVGIEMDEYDFDSHIYSRLKDVRARLAEEEGVPQYHVFSNKTLEAFTRLRPQSVDAGMRIKGVGAVKAEKYLQAFIDELIRG